MIVDRYAPRDLFALVPRLMDEFEPELRELDRLLEDDGRGLPPRLTGAG
jgi:hypothetical protein